MGCSLEERVIEWPNAARKEVIKQEISKHGFYDAIGMMDGTHIILASRPSLQGEGYYNRKGNYSIQCMVINDHNF